MTTHREPTPKENPPATCNELIDHAEIVRVDPFQLVLKIVKKNKVVHLAKRVEKLLVSLVSGDKNRCVGRELVFRVFVNLVGGNTCCMKLKIPCTQTGSDYATQISCKRNQRNTYLVEREI